MGANEVVSRVHHRQPVFLDAKTREMWLDPKHSFKDCFNAIMGSQVARFGDHLEYVEVSHLVNSIRNQTRDCILSKEDYDAKQLKLGLGRFFKKVSDLSEEEKKEYKAKTPEKPTIIKPVREEE